MACQISCPISESRLQSIISGFLATLFLIGAILGLYWVENPNLKLGIVSGLTVAFAGTLALFTNARRQDVFASTAAYAAVLVVFVSGNLATGTSNPGGTTSNSVQGSPITASSSTILTTSTILSTVTTTVATTILPPLETTAQAQATSSVPVATILGGFSYGEIAGIVNGTFLGVIVLAIVIWIYLRSSKKLAGQHGAPSYFPESPKHFTPRVDGRRAKDRTPRYDLDNAEPMHNAERIGIAVG